MKKILFVIPTMRMGGAEQSLVSLLKTIDFKKYEVELLLFEKDGELLERVPSNVKVKEVDAVTQAMLLEFRKYFKKLLKSKNFCAIFARIFMLINSKFQNITGNRKVFNWEVAKKVIPEWEEEYDIAVGYLEGVTDCYVIDKVKALRKVGWIHTDVSKHKRCFEAEGLYYEQFNEIEIISEECRKSFLTYYPSLEEKVKVFENIVNQDDIIRLSKETLPKEFQRGKFEIVTVGRLEYEKGIDIAIMAARQLKDNGVEFKWHVYGKGAQENELQTLIKRLDLQQEFLLEGVVKNPYQYMVNADVIVQSSRYEGKSIVLDEAKILGCPIVVTNYPSAKDQIVDGTNGLVVEMSAEGVARGVKQLYACVELRKKFSQKCKEMAVKGSDTELKIEKIMEG